MGSWGKDPDALAKARARACFNDEPMPGDTRLLVAYIERLEMRVRELEKKLASYPDKP